ncbi:hypothetical protein G159_08910 [Planococcus glaciei CHR43]|nr:hypothetical protein G159_08910 [Planococcus glaciei CHR43]
MSHNVEFQYKYIPNEKWASGHFSMGNHKFEFFCSYMFNNPLEELLSAVYQIVPNLAPFPRKKIDFIMFDLPIEYRWEFELIDEKHVSISIYEKDSDLKTDLIFRDNCHLDDLLRAIVHGIGSDTKLRSTESIERVYNQFKLHLKSH